MKIKYRYLSRFRRKVNRRYKDRLFRFVFSDKKDLLALYNAVNGTDYKDPEQLEINTLEDVLYLSMKNDLSFIIGSSVNLYEHQSTWNRNMPLRGLFYFAELYQDYVSKEEHRLTGAGLISLPTPNYLVFYNGLEEEEERTELFLSDAFKAPPGERTPCLECRATVLNINSGHNRELMGKCRRLWEYAEFIQEIRSNLKKGYALEEAVEESIGYCLEHGILADILSRSRTEVQKMLLREYDEKAEREYLRKEAIEMGFKEGLEKGLEKGLEQGLEKGLEQGRKEGLEQGIARTRCEMTVNVLKSTRNIRQTASILHLSEDQVREAAEAHGLSITEEIERA